MFIRKPCLSEQMKIRQACGRWRVRSSTFFPSSILLFLLSSFLPSFPSSFVFGIYRARIVGGAREPSRDQLLGSIPLRRSYNFVLKSLCFLMPFFCHFGSILGPKMAPKSTEILQKSTSKSHLIFSTISTPLFQEFYWIFHPRATQKSS